MCGASGPVAAPVVAIGGLSPRVRGIHYRHRRAGRRRGSIPACAGSPWDQFDRPHYCWVYPRVCGVTSGYRPPSEQREGLSPRVRGHHGHDLRGTGRHGSIPACAGSPFFGLFPRSITRVYPRVCGVTVSRTRASQPLRGLSPRVRGHLASALRWIVSARSIPACAGSPVSPESAARTTEVYPRVCGVTRSRTPSICVRRGLSPRVRGHPKGIEGLSLWPGSKIGRAHV